MKRFIPVKVTSSESAKKLLNGEVFMRPLGSFKPSDGDVMNNSYRGDSEQGICGTFETINDCPFVEGCSDEFKAVAKKVSYYDDGDSQYLKLFCLYSLMYDYDNDSFLKPDEKMKQFGDTAVIIRDMDEFLRRLLKVLPLQGYEHSLFLMDKVTYYN